MSRYSLQKLPHNFSYFFSINEIKDFEVLAGIRFHSISTGAIKAPEHFEGASRIQSSIRALSISAMEVADGWTFNIYQSGFRSELIPEGLSRELKQHVIEGAIAYIHKIQHAVPTDGLLLPSMWVHVMIIEGKPKISFVENKK